jgi:transcription-repair coupling factor (superfamily II helicase)
MTLIGTALYQKLLTRTVRAAKGEAAAPEIAAELNIGLTGSIPESYVPDATLRINLYARLARMTEIEAIDSFAEELEDRFGPVPSEGGALLDLARIQALSQAARVVRIDAGPKGIALTFAPGARPANAAGGDVSEDRIVWRRHGDARPPGLDEIQHLLHDLV